MGAEDVEADEIENVDPEDEKTEDVGIEDIDAVAEYVDAEEVDPNGIDAEALLKEDLDTDDTIEPIEPEVDEPWVDKDADPVDVDCPVEPETLKPPSGFGNCVDRVLILGPAGRIVAVRNPSVVPVSRSVTDKVGFAFKGKVMDGTSWDCVAVGLVDGSVIPPEEGPAGPEVLPGWLADGTVDI